MRDAGSGTRVLERNDPLTPSIPNSGLRIPDPGSRTPDPEPRIPNPGSRAPPYDCPKVPLGEPVPGLLLPGLV